MKVTRKLNDYNDIYENPNNYNVVDFAEAAAYFATYGDKFLDRCDVLKKRLASYTIDDVVKALGKDKEEFEIGETTYTFRESSVTTTTVDSKEIMKLHGYIPEKYYQTQIVINKEAVLKDYADGTLIDDLKPFVIVATSTTLGIKKKAVRKGIKK